MITSDQGSCIIHNDFGNRCRLRSTGLANYFKMVNGNYILSEDKPSSESEIVDDHVQTRTAERKNKRKFSRNANELQRTLNMAQLDNETDSFKFEKKIKEPRLLRYVPTTEVKENFVTENFETYDLKPAEELPRRYTFQKKPKNPSDGSVNYAYSRSSSNCSSPNGNLPTISEHVEQYGTYRALPQPSPKDDEVIQRHERKLNKYFYKPNDVKSFGAKVSYEGSHPDSLYRVQPSTGSGVDRMGRVLRLLRWPIALVAVCIALAVFVYLLVPDNANSEGDAVNGTYWEPDTARSHSHGNLGNTGSPAPKHHTLLKTGVTKQVHQDTKTPEIDFYDSESDKNADFTSIIDTITETNPHRVLPIEPVFPSHITPEVQYGNEKADANKLRTPKVLEASSTPSDDSTVKPHITQKPEKPLAVYFEYLNEDATTVAETITRAETVNELANYGNKQTTKNLEISAKPHLNYGDKEKQNKKQYDISTKSHSNYEDMVITKYVDISTKSSLDETHSVPEIPPKIEKYYDSSAPSKNNAKFTSGHSMLFGISIEDAEKMRSTTQSSLYNTRVSPTLPTWRDGDDTTTKHYPINVHYEAQCRSTRIPLCREILPYDLAGAPVDIAGVNISSVVSQIEYLVATNCSERLRNFACALLEPECKPPQLPPKLPCFNLCKSIVDSCDGVIPAELSSIFDCKLYSYTNSNSNCVDALRPCFSWELDCGDGSCVPSDWTCDGSRDCPNGKDEAICTSCEKNEYRCSNGLCISKQWLCDGYVDCSTGEDETKNCGGVSGGEPGEESAESAPAPVVRRPNRLPTFGENDSSKELLETSDSNNAFKRNFTRRPPLSRLTPYHRTTLAPPNMEDIKSFESLKKNELKKQETMQANERPAENHDRSSIEDVNIGDVGIFDELKKTENEQTEMNKERKQPVRPKPTMPRRAVQVPVYNSARNNPSSLDTSVAKLDKLIDGAALLKKSMIEEQETIDSPEANVTTEKVEVRKKASRGRSREGSTSAHASPCPSGELRCVDGRCITLAQLCDGTIDCTDHADEDNCYT